MSKSTCPSRLASAATTPDLDINQIQLQNLMDFRNQTNSNDKRFNNVNYVRQVLRRFFGVYNKKSPTINSIDDNSTDQLNNNNNIQDNLISPVLIHPCLQFNKHAKFSGELLLDWFLIHFEGRYENLSLIKQVILQCCTCLIGLDVLIMEHNQESDLFQAENLYSWANNNNINDENTDMEISSSPVINDINHHLIESKEYKYKPPTATTILDILRKCFTLNPIQMSSFIVSKTDSNSKSSSTPITSNRVDENTVRQTMHKLFLHDNINDSSSPGDDDDIRSSLSSSQSFKNDHAKFTSELLLEWITLNSDSRNSNTQALITEVKSCLHSNDNDRYHQPYSSYRPRSSLPSVNEQFTSFPPIKSNYNIDDEIRSLLSDLVIEVDKKLKETSSHMSTISAPPPPPPPLPPPLPPFCHPIIGPVPPSGPFTFIGTGIPPPPPPMMPEFSAPPQLPQYLRKKQKYAVTEPVKKVQWSKINPYTIKKESMWVNVDEEKYVNDTLFSDIRKNFASKIIPSRQPIHDLVDKSKELRVLDSKAAQNFAIMFSQLKVSPSVFREWMLSCDNENLKYDFLKQLEKYLPTCDELKTLADFQNEINDLQYSEQYFCAIGDIKRLKQRLKTLLFKANYRETVEETDKAFVEVRSACDHVRHSIRFKKMLELILTVGNYMNSSAKTYEPVHGFDISFLPKLHSTKANDGRRSLLHFIVQAIQDKHRDLLSFSDEFYVLADGITKINVLELQKQPQEIKRELENAREELAAAKETEYEIDGDRFVEAIEDFISLADDDVARLEHLDEEMTNAYQNLCDFLAIDPKNYSLTEFFTDLKLFCTFFSTCLQEIRAWREQAVRAAKTTNTLLYTEKKILDIPDDSIETSQRSLSRIEALIDKRKKNHGLTPTINQTKKRSQS
ncbi:unnamed protein product [Adineta steineri]|uniref:FH2 domain-containing protein n=1 Tax=Adineta steineri TaxID=433720 RepID=A0A814GPL3_9BILA|nr:unnamed protein product [Adineta steineri]